MVSLLITFGGYMGHSVECLVFRVLIAMVVANFKLLTFRPNLPQPTNS